MEGVGAAVVTVLGAVAVGELFLVIYPATGRCSPAASRFFSGEARCVGGARATVWASWTTSQARTSCPFLWVLFYILFFVDIETEISLCPSSGALAAAGRRSVGSPTGSTR